MSMTSSERLHRFYFHQEMDRPAVIFRWWGFRDDTSYAPLFRLMQEKADWVEPWNATTLIQTTTTPPPLDDAASIDHYLTSPLPEIGGDVSEFFLKKKEVGDRGIVLASLGNNPGGQIAERIGSETFALMTIDNRDLIHRMMQRELDIRKRLILFLIDQGIGPYFAICGQEMIAPPLHGRADFFEFNVQYDRPLADLIHDAQCRLNVHCHGRINAILDGFPALGADVVHCFEAPPMGDVTPAEAKQAWRGQIALEGNIQIADMYEKSPEDIRLQTEALIHDCFQDRRGLAISPTASPFMPGRGQEAYPRYLAMLEAVTGKLDFQ